MRLISFLLLLVFVPACHAGMKVVGASPTLPACPQSYFTDNAGVVSRDAVSSLNARLAAYEKESTDQIVVCIEKMLPEGAQLDSYSKEVFNHWGIGQKVRNNGVLILIFTEDHKIRICVGRGLEKTLSDDTCQRIISENMAPYCRVGDYGKAVDQAITVTIQWLSLRLM
jgi:uncharacterized protein